ncbi:MAG: PD40 domain-containing protein [Armatimonadetes bacterium]|nr:PD40 domain-containing protein [Armatimonadota bacterium]
MNRCSAIILILLLMSLDQAHAPDTVMVRLDVVAPDGASVFYSLPGTPELRLARGMVRLPVSPKSRGLFTLCARAPGCLPVFRHLDRKAVLRLSGQRVRLSPLAYGSSVLQEMIKAAGAYTRPPAREDSARDFGYESTVYSPDARGVAITREPMVEDPFREIDRIETEVWWCPLRPARPVRVARFYPPGDAGFTWSSNLAISPDGEWLAYSQGHGYQEDLHLYNLFTGERRVAAADSRKSEYFPVWSPDGRYLAYVAARGPGGGIDDELPGEAYSLRITRWDGKDNHCIAPAILDVCPAFSPDGTTLAYAGADGLKVYDLSTKKHRRLLSGVQPVGETDRSLQWSPDGEWLALVGIVPAQEEGSKSGGKAGSKSGGSDRPHFVYVVHRSGSPMRRLMRADAGLAWLPDNRLVITNVMLWSAERGLQGGAMVVDVTGKVVEEMRYDLSPTVREPIAGSGSSRATTSPPISLPLPPTLPKITTSIQREGRN